MDAVQVSTSVSGRHKETAWLNWYVLKSVAIATPFPRGKGGSQGWKPSARAQAWMLKAHRMGLSNCAIARSMGKNVKHQTVGNWLKKHLTK